MGNIGFGEVLIIALVIMVLFGTKKLPEFGTALGEFVKRFKEAAREVNDGIKDKDSDHKS
jgi:sec-independent protein translocase protein TatA